MSTAGLRHIRTKPYTPRTKGKAKRFSQTGLREWAYAQAYASSQARQDALADWLGHYNTHRPGQPAAGHAARPDPVSLVRSKGPFLRPDLAHPTTAVAGRGNDCRRRPAWPMTLKSALSKTGVTVQGYRINSLSSVQKHPLGYIALAESTPP